MKIETPEKKAEEMRRKSAQGEIETAEAGSMPSWLKREVQRARIKRRAKQIDADIKKIKDKERRNTCSK